MNTLNNVQIMGFVGTDPEKAEVGGSTLVKFRVATSQYFLKDGKKIEKTQWHTINAWNKMAEKAEKIKKSDLVLIEGSIIYSHVDNEKGRRTFTNIKANKVDILNYMPKEKLDIEEAPATEEIAHNEEIPE
jgi:single-strand DNA-binding protein